MACGKLVPEANYRTKYNKSPWKYDKGPAEKVLAGGKIRVAGGGFFPPPERRGAKYAESPWIRWTFVIFPGGLHYGGDLL
jgi:hypothetical protein